MLEKLKHKLSPSPVLFLSLRKIQCSSLMWAPLSTMSWRRSASAWPTLNTGKVFPREIQTQKALRNNELLSPKEYPWTYMKTHYFVQQMLPTTSSTLKEDGSPYKISALMYSHTTGKQGKSSSLVNPSVSFRFF